RRGRLDGDGELLDRAAVDLDALGGRAAGEVAAVDDDLVVGAGLHDGRVDVVDPGALADGDAVEELLAAAIQEIADLHDIGAVLVGAEVEQGVAGAGAGHAAQLAAGGIDERQDDLRAGVEAQALRVDEVALALLRGQLEAVEALRVAGAVDDRAQRGLLRRGDVVVRLLLDELLAVADGEPPRVADAEVAGGADFIDAGRHVARDRDPELALDGPALRIDAGRLFLQGGRGDAGMREDQAVGAVEVGPAGDADVDGRAGPAAGGLERVDLRLRDGGRGGLLGRGAAGEEGEDGESAEYPCLHHLFPRGDRLNEFLD